MARLVKLILSLAACVACSAKKVAPVRLARGADDAQSRLRVEPMTGSLYMDQRGPAPSRDGVELGQRFGKQLSALQAAPLWAKMIGCGGVVACDLALAEKFLVPFVKGRAPGETGFSSAADDGINDEIEEDSSAAIEVSSRSHTDAGSAAKWLSAAGAVAALLAHASNRQRPRQRADRKAQVCLSPLSNLTDSASTTPTETAKGESDVITACSSDDADSLESDAEMSPLCSDICPNMDSYVGPGRHRVFDGSGLVRQLTAELEELTPRYTNGLERRQTSEAIEEFVKIHGLDQSETWSGIAPSVSQGQHVGREADTFVAPQGLVQQRKARIEECAQMQRPIRPQRVSFS